jgi:hypothetical protein
MRHIKRFYPSSGLEFGKHGPCAAAHIRGTTVFISRGCILAPFRGWFHALLLR